MSILEGTGARDPSLAMCSICANAIGACVYAESMDGEVRLFRTCTRYATGCNDFIPGNLKGMTLQDRAKMMMEMAQYGRPLR